MTGQGNAQLLAALISCLACFSPAQQLPLLQNNTNLIIEAPLQGPEMQAFPAMGWVSETVTGMRAAATVGAVSREQPAVLLQAPREGVKTISLLGTDFAEVEERWGSFTNWHGVSVWIRGSGTPSYATLQWGKNPTHEVVLRTDVKYWRKVHIPWEHWEPRILPDLKPEGLLRIRLDRDMRPPRFDVACIDPLTPEKPIGRGWKEMEPYEARGVTAREGVLVQDPALTAEDVTGVGFLAKHTGRPVYAEVAWVGALDQARSVLISSNFWQRFTVPHMLLPPPDRDPPAFRIALESYPYTGVWAVFDRLRLYRGVADEAIQPGSAVEPEVNIPASTWTRDEGQLDSFHEQQRKGRILPRILVITDSSNNGIGLSYLGMSTASQLSQNAWHRLTRNVRRHYRFLRHNTTQEMYVETQGRWQPIDYSSLNPRQEGVSIHVLHSRGIVNFLSAGGLERAKNAGADVIVIAMGTLDLESTDDQTYRDGLERLITELQSPRTRVVLASPIPMLDARGTSLHTATSYLRRSLDFREICDELAIQHNLPFADIALALLHRGTGYAGSYYISPLLLNHHGHRQVAALLTSVVTDADPMLWDDMPEPIRFATTTFDTENYLAALKGLNPTEFDEFSPLRDNREILGPRSMAVRDDLDKYVRELNTDFVRFKLGILTRDEREKRAKERKRKHKEFTE